MALLTFVAVLAAVMAVYATEGISAPLFGRPCCHNACTHSQSLFLSAHNRGGRFDGTRDDPVRGGAAGGGCGICTCGAGPAPQDAQVVKVTAIHRAKAIAGKMVLNQKKLEGVAWGTGVAENSKDSDVDAIGEASAGSAAVGRRGKASTIRRGGGGM